MVGDNDSSTEFFVQKLGLIIEAKRVLEKLFLDVIGLFQIMFEQYKICKVLFRMFHREPLDN